MQHAHKISPKYDSHFSSWISKSEPKCKCIVFVQSNVKMDQYFTLVCEAGLPLHCFGHLLEQSPQLCCWNTDFCSVLALTVCCQSKLFTPFHATVLIIKAMETKANDWAKYYMKSPLVVAVCVNIQLSFPLAHDVSQHNASLQELTRFMQTNETSSFSLYAPFVVGRMLYQRNNEKQWLIYLSMHKKNQTWWKIDTQTYIWCP